MTFLERRRSAEFEARLDRLLGHSKPKVTPLRLFELPLLPFHNAFGRAQRSLTAKHRVVLLPKTYLARILGTSGRTLDGLHLSPAGHAAMAEMIFRTLQMRGSFSSGRPRIFIEENAG